ncbi:MAG: hypothetical protein ACKVOI_11435 [Dongiaceae bacterium]
MRRKTLSNELTTATAALLLLLAVTPAAQADSNCSDATACGDALDETNPGDNQVGDSGADRDPPDGKRS